MHGVEVDTLRVHPGREEASFGSVYVAPRRRARARPQEIPLHTAESARAVATTRRDARPSDHVPIGTNPGLLARVKNLMR